MSQEQIQLFSETAPKVSAEEMALFLEILRGAGWLNASEIQRRIAAQTGQTWPDRKIRAVASASKGKVLSYPGSPGYRLLSEATIEEVQTASAKLRHQANEMTLRAVEIDRLYHAKAKP